LIPAIEADSQLKKFRIGRTFTVEICELRRVQVHRILFIATCMGCCRNLISHFFVFERGHNLLEILPGNAGHAPRATHNQLPESGACTTGQLPDLECYPAIRKKDI
jgi:hypothetical protein